MSLLYYYYNTLVVLGQYKVCYTGVHLPGFLCVQNKKQ